MEEEKGKVVLVDVSEEMKDAYLSYAMSVIVGRALPDVRDGLKPVQRRILYAMHEMNLRYGEPYRKSARVVGDVLGKYHPHGDMAVYEALVRMAQDFTYRYPLVDGHGNFGSVDGDPPAAMRYTEVRMSAIAGELLTDLEKETVDFVPNFDESVKEPTVLPAGFPQLLANGSSGIAVGMATNIPPHNLGELIDALLYLIDHPEADWRDLLTLLPGPDFPTAGKIVGKKGIEDYFREGRGKFTLQGEAIFEEIGKNRQALIIREIPYQANKSQLVEHIARLVEDKKLSEVSEIRDESDRDGIRIVLELRKGANPQYVVNYLLKHTAFRVSFGVTLLALVNGKPEVLGMKEALQCFLEYRKEVVIRRSKFELKEAEERMHILEGFLRALDQIDAVITLIRASSSVQEAKEGLMQKFLFTEKQSQAILEMRLQRLVALEREKIATEYAELEKRVKKLQEILAHHHVLVEVIREELKAIREKYADERRTRIVDEEEKIEEEELIREEDIVITLTRDGYVKRVPLLVYRRQGRGGKGVTGITTKEEDLVSDIVVTTTLAKVLFFTSTGRVFLLPAHRIVEAPRQSKGIHLANLLPLEGEERVLTIIPIRDFQEGKYLFFVTAKGKVKKSDLLEFMSITRKGIRAITLDSDDVLSTVFITQGDNEVFIATARGYGLLFSEKEVRPMGRTAGGVRGISLRSGDRVVGACLVRREETLLVVASSGLGKRIALMEFPLHHRGGKGIIIMREGKRTGELVGIASVSGEEEVLISAQSGLLIRLHLSGVPIQGRMTQGVRLIRLKEDDKIADFALVR
ncbi:MAG: DNA gyrase subunit A [Candidatus Caldatribacteriaceae bacterium]